jgi:hypothetical protein
VKFASQSLEQVWWRVENDADATFAAVRDGSALQPGHLDRLRDLIAVHHARSIQYYAVFEDNRLRASQEAHRFWRQFPAVLDAVAASRLGLPGGDTDSRERAFQELNRNEHAVRRSREAETTRGHLGAAFAAANGLAATWSVWPTLYVRMRGRVVAYPVPIEGARSGQARTARSNGQLQSS